MEDHLFRCKHCRKTQRRRRRDQQYCGHQACQRARNNAWRRAKNASDPDYRANQRASSAAWIASQGGSAAYHRRYRRRRKEQRREGQARRNDEADRGTPQDSPPVTAPSANSNVKSPQSFVISGRYRLSPCGGANSNAVLVDLTVITDG